MAKVKSFCNSHKYSIFIFLVLMLYNCFISTDMMEFWKVSEMSYSFHVVDFSVGFCTKIWPGAICDFLFDEFNEIKVSIYLTVLYILSFLIIACLLEKFIKKHIEYKKTIFITLAFFLVGPATISVFVQMFGWFDFYWMLMALLSIIFLSKKELYFLVIPAMIAAVMAHFAAIICYVPFICIYMLYKISVSKDKREKAYLWVVWIITVIVSLGLGVYMIINEPNNVNYTMEEFHTYLESRGAKSFYYYDYSFFKDYFQDVADVWYGFEAPEMNIKSIDFTKPDIVIIIQMIIMQVKVTFKLISLDDNIIHFLLIIPIVFLLYKMIIYCFKYSEENKLKRFSLFCSMILLPVTILSGFLFSEDVVRWLSHGVIPMFIMVLFLFDYEDDKFRKKMSENIEKIPMKIIIPFFIVNMFTVGVG